MTVAVAYYVPAQLYRHRGIRSRVDMTVAAWRRAGVDVHLVTGGVASKKAPSTILNGLLAHRSAEKEAISELEELLSGGIDAIHMRLFWPIGPWRSLALRGTPVSVEVHAPMRRSESNRDLPRVLFGGLGARKVLGTVPWGAFITRELAELPEYRSVPRRLAIGNGVELGEACPAPDNPVPIVGMSAGSNNAWHGVDRLAQLAGLLPHVRFQVVHPAGVDLVIPPELEAVATADQTEYRAALSQWDAAVGSLNLADKGLTEAAPLKVRDYADIGIPTILPYRDTNLSCLADPLLLHTHGDPRAWDVAAIGEWIHDARGQRLAATSRQAVSIDVVERPRLAQFQSSDPPGNG